MEAMTLSVSTSRTATPGVPAGGAALETRGLDTRTDKGAAVAAIELMRKWRLFIRGFDSGSSAVYLCSTPFGRTRFLTVSDSGPIILGSTGRPEENTK